jgi:hypothetical protein
VLIGVAEFVIKITIAIKIAKIKADGSGSAA